MYGNFDGQGVLLTGDAGVQALNRTASCAEFNQLDLPGTLRFMQIPHHGSRHNVSTSSLDRLIGRRLPFTGASAERYPAQKSAWLDDATYQLEVPFVNETELLMDVLRHGDQVSVIGPPSLVALIADRLESASQHYKGRT